MRKIARENGRRLVQRAVCTSSTAVQMELFKKTTWITCCFKPIIKILSTWFILYFSLAVCLFISGFVGWLSRISDVLPPLRSWVRAQYRTSDRMWEEFVNTLPKVVGFLRVLRFPPTGKNLTAWARINS